MRSGMHIKEPSHILGKLVETAMGVSPVFRITGTDWPTRDGTGIRDYIHVSDLALAHVKAMERFDEVLHAAATPDLPYVAINLGTGKGVTVRRWWMRLGSRSHSKGRKPPRPGCRRSYANANKARS